MDDDAIERSAREQLGPLFPKLARAIRLTDGTHTLADVVRGIAAGTYQLHQSDRSLIITEVVTYPRCKAVSVFLAAGDLTDLYSTIQPRLEAFARSVGADRLHACGRHGWARSAKQVGWKPRYTVITKRLETAEDAP